MCVCVCVCVYMCVCVCVCVCVYQFSHNLSNHCDLDLEDSIPFKLFCKALQRVVMLHYYYTWLQRISIFEDQLKNFFFFKGIFFIESNPVTLTLKIETQTFLTTPKLLWYTILVTKLQQFRKWHSHKWAKAQGNSRNRLHPQPHFITRWAGREEYHKTKLFLQEPVNSRGLHYVLNE